MTEVATAGATGPLLTALAVSPASPAQVWMIRFDGDEPTLADAEALVTPAERERARRGTAQVHRRRILLRAALRELLGRHLGVPPLDVPLRTNPAGRPHLAAPTGLDLNCSAGNGIGLVALAAGHDVGVDLELVAPWSADVLHEGWLSAEEQAAVSALARQHRAEAVTRSWTQKEAVLKGRGTGLAGGPAHVPTPVGHGAGCISGWDVATVAVPADHVATVATRPRRGARPRRATTCAPPSSARIRGPRP